MFKKGCYLLKVKNKLFIFLYNFFKWNNISDILLYFISYVINDT